MTFWIYNFEYFSNFKTCWLIFFVRFFRHYRITKISQQSKTDRLIFDNKFTNNLNSCKSSKLNIKNLNLQTTRISDWYTTNSKVAGLAFYILLTCVFQASFKLIVSLQIGREWIKSDWLFRSFLSFSYRLTEFFEGIISLQF